MKKLCVQWKIPRTGPSLPVFANLFSFFLNVDKPKSYSQHSFLSLYPLLNLYFISNYRPLSSLSNLYWDGLGAFQNSPCLKPNPSPLSSSVSLKFKVYFNGTTFPVPQNETPPSSPRASFYSCLSHNTPLLPIKSVLTFVYPQ